MKEIASAFLGGVVGGVISFLAWKLLTAVWRVWEAGMREMGRQAAIRDAEREKREVTQ